MQLTSVYAFKQWKMITGKQAVADEHAMYEWLWLVTIDRTCYARVIVTLVSGDGPKHWTLVDKEGIIMKCQWTNITSMQVIMGLWHSQPLYLTTIHYPPPPIPILPRPSRIHLGLEKRNKKKRNQNEKFIKNNEKKSVRNAVSGRFDRALRARESGGGVPQRMLRPR